MSGPTRILYVDDSAFDRDLVRDALEKEHGGFVLTEAASPDEFEALLATGTFDLVLSDFHILGFSGLQVMEAVRAKDPRLPVIIVTGTGSEEIAVEAMKQGAADYVLKTPRHIQRLPQAIYATLERKRLQDEHDFALQMLYEREERFRSIIENSSDGIFLLNEAATVLYASPAATSILGYPAQELVGMNGLTLLHPDDLPAATQLFVEIMQFPGVNFTAQYRMKHQDGSMRWVEGMGINLLDKPSVGAVISNFRDVTARKEAELVLQQTQAAEREQRILAEALRDTAAALAGTVDLPAVMNLILDTVGKVVPHDAASIMLMDGDHARVAYAHGYAPPLMDFFKTHDFSNDNYSTIRQMAETGAPVLVYDTLLDKNWTAMDVPGAEFLRSYAGVPIRVHGQIMGYLNLDSTEPGHFTQTHAEQLQTFANQAAVAIENAQLYEEIRGQAAGLEQRVTERTSELNRALERVEAILNSSNDAILLTSLEGVIHQTNPAFDTMFACNADDYFGVPLSNMVQPDDVPHLQATLQQAREQSVAALEVELRRKDGAMFHAEVSFAPISASTSIAANLVCVLRDISVRKEADAALRRALQHERDVNMMRARFTSMVSHEFRTPLSAITMIASTLTNYDDRFTPDDRRHRLDKIVQQVDLMVSLLEEVLTVGLLHSGKLEFKPKEVNLRDHLHDLVMQIATAHAAESRVHFVSDTDNTSALVDASLMRLIINNLITNAIKYAPGESPITVELMGQGDVATLRIRDEGIGIPREDLEKLFEPFRRASNVGNITGTGLGLSIVKQAVEMHGGTIRCESELNRGTTFFVELPTLAKQAE